MNKIYQGEWTGTEPLPARFHQLPIEIYHNSRNWIPEVPSIVEHMFSAANRYFSIGSVWLDVREGVRFAGFLSPIQNINGKHAAYFGYWETIDDVGLNKDVFSEFERWAKSKGAEVVYGPINFTTYGMYRLRVDSFDTPQFIGEPFNPSYYPELIASLGYSCSQKYATSNMSNLRSFEKDHKEVVEKLEPELRKSFNIYKVTSDYWMENIEKLHELSLEIFKNNFAYMPISLDDFEKVCGDSFARKICAYSSVVAETSEGKIAGMMLNFPDFSPLVNQSSVLRMTPDQVDFGQHFKHLPDPVLLVKTAGVANEYRGKHLYTYLFSKSLYEGMKHYKNALGCLFILDNPSRRTSDRMTSDLRHYALFRKEL